MRNQSFGLAVALPLVFSVSLAAQNKPTEPSRDTSDVVTVTGCVQPEKDYRAEIKEGKGGLADTGIGESHQFVLRSARTVDADTLKPIGTAGKFEDVYTLGGNLESELGKVVGHEVAIAGYVKVEATKGTEKVPDLPEMMVVGWHNVSDHCAVTKATK